MASLLFPANHSALCDAGHLCEQAVVQAPTPAQAAPGSIDFRSPGRWFITFGHCGFNSRANNGSGFATKAQAVACVRRHQRAAFTARIEARAL